MTVRTCNWRILRDGTISNGLSTHVNPNVPRLQISYITTMLDLRVKISRLQLPTQLDSRFIPLKMCYSHPALSVRCSVIKRPRRG